MSYLVPFVNYPIQYKNLEEQIDKAIKKVLLNGDLILRQDVEDLEQNIAQFVNTKYAVGVNSCTDALIFSLKAAGIGAGDQVITVSHTFWATIEVIHHCGAEPVLVDIAEDFIIDTDKIERAITSKTKAIIPVHLNGRVCNMKRLTEIARSHKLVIIEDAAQALGARFNGKMAGSYGLAGCFSFYPAKILGCWGDGGLVTTNDAEVAEKVRRLRNHGLNAQKEISDYGFTSRLHNIQAAVLNIKFKYLPDWISRRREIAGIYDEGLANIAEIKLPPAPDSDSIHFDAYQNYVLQAEKRNELFQFLMEKGVETLIKDPVPNHWNKGLGLSHFHLPLTEKLADEVISLPMYPELTNEQIEYVVRYVRNFYLK